LENHPRSKTQVCLNALHAWVRDGPTCLFPGSGCATRAKPGTNFLTGARDDNEQ
jgi:hypothetical protein